MKDRDTTSWSAPAAGRQEADGTYIDDEGCMRGPDGSHKETVYPIEGLRAYQVVAIQECLEMAIARYQGSESGSLDEDTLNNYAEVKDIVDLLVNDYRLGDVWPRAYVDAIITCGAGHDMLPGLTCQDALGHLTKFHSARTELQPLVAMVGSGLNKVKTFTTVTWTEGK